MSADSWEEPLVGGGRGWLAWRDDSRVAVDAVNGNGLTLTWSKKHSVNKYFQIYFQIFHFVDFIPWLTDCCLACWATTLIGCLLPGPAAADALTGAGE